MSLAILGVGTSVPPLRVTQKEAAAVAQALCCRTEREAALVSALHRQTEIATRHMVPGNEWLVDALRQKTNRAGGTYPGPDTAARMRVYAKEALPLGLEASRRALDDAGVATAAITHLVTVSCTGFSAPGLDVGLVNGLGLRPTVARTQVGYMGCHGAFNGLAVARALAAADPSARVLLCSVELCSLHYHFPWDPQAMVSNALFADGAAALVGAADGPAATGWRALATGSCLLPDSEDAMTWTITNHGFVMTLSPRVPSLIAAHLRPWLADWLAGHGLTIADVGSWAIHPGGVRILTAAEEALGLPRGTAAVSREVLREFGNMSSATVLFILERLRQRGTPRPCVALGFGPGLVAEAALFR
jgi:predicted naringenin-chalcone synthase